MQYYVKIERNFMWSLKTLTMFNYDIVNMHLGMDLIKQ
jgi:hypothetical protein